jgi:hypothetical protein
MTPAAPGSATAQRYHGASSSAAQGKSATTKLVFVSILYSNLFLLDLKALLKQAINVKKRNNIMQK